MPPPTASRYVAEAVRQAALRLTPVPVRSIEPAGAGANSHVFRVGCDSIDFALKQYPAHPDDTRDRLGVEWQTLTFLTESGVDNVPAPTARSPEGDFLLMEWIEGKQVDCQGENELREALRFVTRIFELSDLPAARSFPLASEACLSGRAIADQIERRIGAFGTDDMLTRYLDDMFIPVYQRAKEAVLRSDWAGELPAERRRLIPADFGFHNALRTADGRMRFFDFDYFGWDDPVKVAADFILHPGMALYPGAATDISAMLAEALPDDPEFTKRLVSHLPLYALRWSIILLNGFRVDRMGNGRAGDTDRERLLLRQLAKAEKMIHRSLNYLNAIATDRLSDVSAFGTN